MSKHAAGIVPLRRESDGWRVLILRVYRNWDFPKGLVDPGEEVIATAIREAAEEADLRDLEFPWGPVSFDTAPYSRGKIATYFPAITRRTDVVLPVSPELGRPEHHEGRWVTFAAARELLPERLQSILTAVESVVDQGGSGSEARLTDPDGGRIVFLRIHRQERHVRDHPPPVHP